MIYIPSNGPDDWAKGLAQVKHWRTGYSAKSLAYCWEEAKGFPSSVVTALKNSNITLLNQLTPLFIFPEWKVNLPGGSRASQNDIFVIAKSGGELISIMVEGKVSEPFGPLVSDWQEDNTAGKKKRLSFLLNELGLKNIDVSQTRYQLLHRTASAIIEAKKINARNAMILVHSFSQADEGFKDFQDFVWLYGLVARKDSVVGPYNIDGIDLYFSWVKGEAVYLNK